MFFKEKESKPHPYTRLITGRSNRMHDKKILENLGYELNCKFDELVPIDELRPDPNNAKPHPPEQVAHLAEVMKANGVQRAISVSKLSGLIAIGHCQYLAMRLNGWEYAPVEYKTYRDLGHEFCSKIADNAVSEYSRVDMTLVNSQFQEHGPDIDINAIGIKGFVVDPAEKESEGGGATAGGQGDPDDQKIKFMVTLPPEDKEGFIEYLNSYPGVLDFRVK